MTPEDRLRQAIDARAHAVEPSPDGLNRIEEKLMEAQENQNKKRWLVGGGIAAALAAVVIGVVVLQDDDSEVDTVGTSTTTTEATTTTTTEATTTTTFAPTVDPAAAIFPDPLTSARYDDPVAVAQAFATQMAGFADPVVGAFQAGDARSGEVEVRGFAAGVPSVISVRQLEDDTWFVIAANAESIRLDSPTTGATVASPLPLSGAAYAFEGTVGVRLLQDGDPAPIGETFVTGRGDGVLGDFTGELTFGETSAANGVLLLTEASANDGSTTAVTAIRVAF